MHTPAEETPYHPTDIGERQGITLKGASGAMDCRVPVLAVSQKLGHLAPSSKGHCSGLIDSTQTEPIIPLALGVEHTVEMLLDKE